MKTITITDKSTETSRVICRRDVLAKALPEVLKGYRKVFVFSDHTVWGLYGKRVVRALGNVDAYTMTAGEAHKTPETLLSLLADMAKAGLHRNDCLVCLGGGVPGDVGGLAAALYMRGIDCIQGALHSGSDNPFGAGGFLGGRKDGDRLLRRQKPCRCIPTAQVCVRRPCFF